MAVELATGPAGFSYACRAPRLRATTTSTPPAPSSAAAPATPSGSTVPAPVVGSVPPGVASGQEGQAFRAGGGESLGDGDAVGEDDDGVGGGVGAAFGGDGGAAPEPAVGSSRLTTVTVIPSSRFSQVSTSGPKTVTSGAA
ncbi:hypothetical protein ACIPLC_30620 [Kitasatospora sp. NPDC086801]|uniref:hypothetical protein n=1 Tax=Kitasatospora sp. NPDC086801 TaxID=3364066 RepID=UPI00381A8F6F